MFVCDTGLRFLGIIACCARDADAIIGDHGPGSEPGVKLLSWNLNTNRGRAVLDAVMARVEPDVLLLQESARPPGTEGACCGRVVPGYRWGSWVVARRGTIRTMRIAGYEGWVSGGMLAIDDARVYVFSIHTPGSRPGLRRLSYVKESRRFVDAILARVPRSATLIIGGDFNFSIGERVDGDPRPIRPSELAALRAFRDEGFSIAWRDMNRERPLAQTLRWMREPSTPYHCDGFLVRARGAPVASCRVLDDPTLHGHSDHNPVLLELTNVH